MKDDLKSILDKQAYRTYGGHAAVKTLPLDEGEHAARTAML